ncbi:signal recognition particle receptor beta subunit-domain-containing protein [Dioszegia hungarica]|uniref:Signal recognition particle receptor subunit beta n=1 Tax=Dioszegia hungarica TaxID=4972 RepID=A0AA38LWN7_9TREE|nr:signal recognition particle receptor beta subunit-domain-containing protein [Dioszegia hungarica]KAI9638565.1 signal recognition particle receptor beta subunit-domain-containing protein [Dioszegia hungarica]
MASPRNAASGARVTPEVESISSLLLHPLLQDPKFVAAVLAVFLSVVLFTCKPSAKRRVGGRSGTPTVLLVGPADSGKTALFAKLAHGSRTETHTSITPSSTTFSLDSEDPARTAIRLVDIPGHPRLRDEVKRNLKTASAVVFVVDIQALLRNAGAIAEELPPILTTVASASLASGQPTKLLLLASKADLLSRPSPTTPSPTLSASTRQTAADRLSSVLTREMDRLKQSRASTGGRIEGIGRVQSSGGTGLAGLWKRFFGGRGGGDVDDAELEEDETLVWGGRGTFRWEDVEGVEIAWGVSALGAVKAVGEEGEGLDEVREWLRSV